MLSYSEDMVEIMLGFKNIGLCLDGATKSHTHCVVSHSSGIE